MPTKRNKKKAQNKRKVQIDRAEGYSQRQAQTALDRLIGTKNRLSDARNREILSIAAGASDDPVQLQQLVNAAGNNPNFGHLAELLTRAGPNPNLAQVTALLTAVGRNGSIRETTALLEAAQNHVPDALALIQAVQHHHPGTPITAVDALVQAVGANGTMAQLTGLVNSVGNHGTVADTTTLLQRVQHHQAGTAITAVDGLVQAMGANGTIAQLTGLVNSVGNHGTVADTTTLLQRVQHHQAGTAITAVDALVQAVGANGTMAHLTGLVNSVANHGTVADTTTLLQRVQHHQAGTAITAVDALVQAVGANGTMAHLTGLVNSVANHGTVADTTTLLQRVQHHQAGTAITAVDALVQAVGANGTIAQLTGLVNAVANHGTVADTTTLLQRVQHHQAGTAVTAVDALVQAVGANGTIAQLTGLVNSVGNHGTVADTTTLLQRVQHHQAGTAVTAVDALVQAVGANGTIAQLTGLVNAVANHGTVADTTTLLQRVQHHQAGTAVTAVDALVQAMGANGTIAHLTGLVNSVANGGTVAQTTALLQRVQHHQAGTAVTAVDALVRATWVAGAVAPPANVCVDLATLVDSVTNQSTVAQTTTLLQRIAVHNPLTSLTTTNALIRATWAAGAAAPPANVCVDLATIVDSVTNQSTVAQTTTLLQHIAQHNPGTTLTHANGLIRATWAVGAAAPPANVCVDLTTIVDSVTNQSTVAQTTTLLQRIAVHNPGTTLNHTNLLIRATWAVGAVAPPANVCVDLATIVDSVTNQSTVAQTTTLLQRIAVHNPGTTLNHTNLLIRATWAVGAAAPPANVCVNLRTIVDSVANQGTVAQTTTLLQGVAQHNPGTTLPNINLLIRAAWAPGAGAPPANVCVDLTAIVGAVQNNGTVPQITQMVTTTVNRLNAGQTNLLLPLINRNPGQNTPPRVEALLNALIQPTALARRNRFALIEPRIPRFLRQPAPANPPVPVNYNPHGHNFLCNRFDYFYQRHTYQYFNFAMANNLNSLWGGAINTANQLNAVMGAISQPDANTLALPGYRHVTWNNHEVGVNHAGWIRHFMPRGAAIDVTFTLAEIQAIDNLR